MTKRARLPLLSAAFFLVLGRLAAADSGGDADKTPDGFKQVGKASYYGDQHQGKPTATGEPFDKEEMTAAHKTLPLGAKVEVENPKTGDSVEVRINDRGPYVRGRVIDLSERAAEELGIKEEGVAKVVVKKPEGDAVKE